jgi:predicted phosphate transport protein (TIGR00153 family)
MLTDKEKKVKELIDEHVRKVQGCLECFKGCFEAFLQGDPAEAESIHANCDHAETDADMVRRRIGDDLYSGAFLPIARKDIYMLTEYVDEIANKAEAASDMIVSQRPNVPDDYKKVLQEIVDIMSRMFGVFQGAVALFEPYETLQADDSLAAIREKITSVGVMESEVDNLEETLMRTIFRSDLPLANKIQLERFLRRITHISDVMEDAAERLHVLVIRERI